MKNKDRIEELANDRGFPQGCSALILVFADRSVCMDKPVWKLLPVQDAAAAIQNVLLMATAYDIASCWWSALPSMDNSAYLHNKTWENVLKKFNLPPLYEIQGIVLLGYVNESDMCGDDTHHGRPVRRKDVKEYIYEAS